MTSLNFSRARLGNRCPRTPLQTQPFDEQPSTGSFQHGHPVFDCLSGHRVRRVAWLPCPPGKPGHRAVAAQGHPHPLGPSATGIEVVGQLLVEDVGQAVEEFEFSAPGHRAHGQVVLLWS
jgi:hypothetical protein